MIVIIIRNQNRIKFIQGNVVSLEYTVIEYIYDITG